MFVANFFYLCMYYFNGCVEYKHKAYIGCNTYVLNCINTCPTLNTEDVVFAEYKRAMFRALDSLMVNHGVA